MTFKVLRNTDQVFCRMSLSLDLPDFFSLDYTEVMVLGKKGHEGEVPFFSNHTKVNTVNMAYHC